MRRTLAVGLWAAALLLGCAGDERAEADASTSTGSAGGGGSASTSTGDGGGGTGGGAAPFDPDAPVPLATDVAIERIQALQSVTIPLADKGAPLPGDTPIVANRDLTLRVFLAAVTPPKPVEIQVVLEPEAGEPSVLSLPWNAGAAGSDGALDSTPRVLIPKALVQPGLRYAVRVLDSKAPPVGTNESQPSRFPMDGSRTNLGASPVPVLPITIVPLRWDADGSGRLPDTGPAALEAMRSLLLAQYPLHDLTITVHAPVPYDHGLNFFGNVDFDDVNDLLYDLRADEAPASDVYYYGLVKPADSFNAYCGGSCVTGQSYTVEDPTDDDLRLGAGVAFDPVDAAGTLAHELGHMFGRYHSPCGVKSWDDDYPYADGVIGVWGWDQRDASLKDPQLFTDFMGYCDDQWVSDYTYRALFDRILAVGLPKSMSAAAPGLPVRVIHVDAEGQITLGRRVASRAPGRGASALVRWRDVNGATLAGVPARAVRKGHDGGYSLFVTEVPGAVTAEVITAPRW